MSCLNIKRRDIRPARRSFIYTVTLSFGKPEEKERSPLCTHKPSRNGKRKCQKRSCLFCQNEIYLELRFLKPALSALTPKPDGNLQTFGTDGVFLYYSAEQVIRVFQSNSRFLDRAFLHTILHCIFSHLWIAGERDARIWNLACDIVTEYTIDQMDQALYPPDPKLDASGNISADGDGASGKLSRLSFTGS